MKILDEVKSEVEQLFVLQTNIAIDKLKSEFENYKPVPITVIIDKVPFVKQKGEFYHAKLPDVMRCVSLGIPVFLTGDAGSGKTTIAEQCAAILKLPYYCISVCLQTSETTFLGYRDAHGNYVRTLFREAYEHGGVFLIDEIDNGNPNVISVLNAALANKVCAFADGMIQKHTDFRLIASGNTVGRGASRQYVGRLEMDMATLDRFCVITIDYDKKIEYAIADEEVIKKIGIIRSHVNEKKIRLIVSPRASMNITRLIKNGISYRDALDMCVFKGCDKSIKEQMPDEVFRL